MTVFYEDTSVIPVNFITAIVIAFSACADSLRTVSMTRTLFDVDE
jgi:hypothetical protein